MNIKSETYALCKQIYLGHAQMPREFQSMADFIAAQWGVRPMYIEFIPASNPESTALLCVCMRTWAECMVFNGHPAQQRIAAQFQAIHPTPRLHVSMDAFGPAAMQEVMELVPAGTINSLTPALDPQHLWKIMTVGGTITFFVYTDQQKQQCRSDGSYDRWIDAVYNIIAPYDTEHLCIREALYVELDSKENFDTNYSGNWYYYYK